MSIQKCEVAADEKHGRYLKAAGNINEGSLLLKESPLIIGPRDNGIVFCFRCCKILSVMKVPVCASCKAVTVCSEHCKGKWHTREECEYLSKSSLNCGYILSRSQIIMPLRCLILREIDGDKWNELMQLESHLEERRDCDAWNDVKENVEKVFLNTGLIKTKDIEEELVQKICGILDVNTFEIRSAEFEGDQSVSSLRGLYLKASLMNHDCVGNTHLAMDDHFNLIVHASRAIASGENIYFNYTNPLKGTHERSLFLQGTKYFVCNCKRCTDPSELGTEISSIKCPKCKKGFVRKVQPDVKSSWICNSCEKSFSPTLIHSTIAEARQQIDSMNPSSIVDAENLLQKLSRTFAPNHFFNLELKQNLVGLYTQNAPKERNLVRKIELCNELLSVFRIIEPGISRMQGITLYELQNASVLLYEKQANEKTISKEALMEKLKEAEEILKESVKHLLYEPKTTPEGRLCLDGFKELQALKSFQVALLMVPDKESRKRQNTRLNKIANC